MGPSGPATRCALLPPRHVSTRPLVLRDLCGLQKPHVLVLVHPGQRWDNGRLDGVGRSPAVEAD